MVPPVRRGMGIPRIRSVISGSRPSHAGSPDDDRLARLWDNCRAAVGVVRIDGTCCATAWRLPGDTPRVATAGHVLWRLLPPGDQARSWGGAVVGGAEVVFDDDGKGGAAGIAITGYAMAHPLWDMCILTLAPAVGDRLSEPLDLAPVQHPGSQPMVRSRLDIAVIGYPGELADTGTIFHGPWLRHISGGVVLGPSALGTTLHQGAGTGSPVADRTSWEDGNSGHDASTCPGFSGGPVLDLETAKVVGIHVWGSIFAPDTPQDWDWNDMVDLSAVRSDPWLDDQLRGSGTTAPPPDGHPVWIGDDADRDSRISAPEAARRMARRLRRLSPRYLLAGVAADRPDFRDFPFIPSLARPRSRVLPPMGVKIGDQGGDATCAAFAVAAAIEPQLKTRRMSDVHMKVSVRMLDALAREQDEFMDDDVAGTTLRGVLKGFFENGVCHHAIDAAGDQSEPFLLTRAMARDARGITLGAYYRVAPVLTDMQMAVQEAGAVVVSAHLHKGWQPPGPGGTKQQKAVGVIPFTDLDACPRDGAHAFLVTGYTDRGFVIQNSWGPGWGEWRKRPGHALWSYADWAANVIDAWVMRVAAPAPAGFGLIAGHANADDLPAPRRAQLLGHMIHTEADRIVERGTLGLGLRAIGETARFLSGKDASDRKAALSYDRLALVFHDPLLGGDLIARIATRMTPQMKARRTYPIHLCHGLDEMRTLSLRLVADAELVREGFAKSLLPSDSYLERFVAPVSQRLVEQYRQGAIQAAQTCLAQALTDLLAPAVLGSCAHRPKARTVTVLGVGTGAIPAMACADLFDRAVSRVFLSPPVTVPQDSTIWRLGPERKEGAVPGYPGEWVDLLSVSLGQAVEARGTDPQDPGFAWGSLAAALIDPALIARLCR